MRPSKSKTTVGPTLLSLICLRFFFLQPFTLAYNNTECFDMCVGSGVATGGGGRGGGNCPPGSGKWKIRKFAIWGEMTPNYSAVLDFYYQLPRHGLLPSNNYSQSPTKQLNKSGST